MASLHQRTGPNTKKMPKRGRTSGNPTTISYSTVGVDRKRRERARISVSSLLTRAAFNHYPLGRPRRLPFGVIFPETKQSKRYFDLQIEGVGTKTLVAELADKFYENIGIDAVAMSVNDTIRSGAKPILISDALHINASTPSQEMRIRDVLKGILAAARESGSFLASGETGNVAEILHEPLSEDSPSFDVFVSSLGIVEDQDIIEGTVSEGDVVIGVESSGIHSNGLTLARRLLLKRWGGCYEHYDVPETLSRPVADEIMIPTRIYVTPLLESMKRVKVKAALHVTGDGLSKFNRLLDYEKNKSKSVGFIFGFDDEAPPIFRLIQECARRLHLELGTEEMFRTFNMGIGFAVVVDKEEEGAAIDSFNRYYPARRIGRVARDHMRRIVASVRGSKFVL